MKDLYEQTKEALKAERGKAMATTKKLEKIVSKDDVKLLERDLTSEFNKQLKEAEKLYQQKLAEIKAA